MKKYVVRKKDIFSFFCKEKLLRLNIIYNILFFLYISVVLIGINVLSIIYNWNIKLVVSIWILGLILFILFKITKGIK